MSTNRPDDRPRFFISHSSKDLNVAVEAEGILQGGGFDVWLDKSDIRVGALLRTQLRRGIEASRAVVLLWSWGAATSRWVSSEILTAFHLDRFILPCVLDDVDLPQFLSRSFYLDLRDDPSSALGELLDQVERAPDGHNRFPLIQPFQSDELKAVIRGLVAGQRQVLAWVGRDSAKAGSLQDALDTAMTAAEERWRYDPTILNLAGYHRKNRYMIDHWEEYCAGRFPTDPVLEQGERRFFETLFVNPTEYSALNGLGNILLFEGELDAAEFFVERAIACAARAGVKYREAEGDLEVIRSRRAGS